MNLQNEIENYLEINNNKTTEGVVSFLIKLWNADSLKSSTKYDTIFKYFTENLLPDLLDNKTELQRFLKLKHPSNSVSFESKKVFVKTLSSRTKDSPTLEVISISLDVCSHDGFKDFFKTNLKIYSKFLETIIRGFNAVCEVEHDEVNASSVLSNIISELYCFVKMESFDKLFLEHVLVPLSKASMNSTVKSEFRELLKTIFLSRPTSPESSLEIFESELSEEAESILMTTFIEINKFKSGEILKFIKFYHENKLEDSEDDEEFLTETMKLFKLLASHEVDLAPIKRQEAELFESLAERITTAVESQRLSMDFAKFLEILSSFIFCDAFLFERNIYDLTTDCMLREKSAVELENYENLFKVVLKIYGKDLNQFLKKLLKSIDEKLESLTLPKKRKRKLLSGGEVEVTPKKQKTSSDSSVDKVSDWSYISHVWSAPIADQFAEIISSLNVAQTVKVWKQLNDFLENILSSLKESSNINENVLFKIEFASFLLSTLFTHTRITEQLMYKSEEISASVKTFNLTQHSFYEIILNIEYNNRVMNAFLKLSCSYEKFLMLYFYHHNTEMKSSLESQFIGNESQVRSEWEIIQQRIKNFGKADEKNNLNSLMIQQKQKSQLFASSDVVKADYFSSIFNDEKQISFLLQKLDTRSFFINSLGKKELKDFVQYLIRLEDKEVQAMALHVVAQSQILLDAVVAEIVYISDKKNLKSSLEILNQLPLACVTEENKKMMFKKILSLFSDDHVALIKRTMEKSLKNDSYKMFFKDFTMQEVAKVLQNFEEFSNVYHLILSNAARKMNTQTLENFNWITNNDDAQIIEVMARVASEVPLTPSTGVTAQAINNFKLRLIEKLLSNFDSHELSDSKCSGFIALARLCSDNAATLTDDAKAQYLILLKKFVSKIIKSPSVERVKLLTMTLKDAKKLNLNDELKTMIVDTLLVYLKSTLLQRMSDDGDAHQDFELETQMFTQLKPFKSNFQQGCVDILTKTLKESSEVSTKQLNYSFKIYQIAVEAKSDDKSYAFIKNYKKFYDKFLPKAFELEDEGKTDVLAQIVETNNSVLKDSKFQLDNTVIDDMLCLLVDPRIKPDNNIDRFFKLYAAIGESLFVIATVRQNYFRTRIAQFFSIYKSLMEAVYFFKNETEEEITSKEVLLLLKLALQLEHIMKMITKIHSKSLHIISPYIASTIVTIFVKNPKTFSIGYKFKVNIKNICYQLLSTFDDKTRKHVYSVADETAREVYDGLFMELRRKF